jgi:hypothetical protein
VNVVKTSQIDNEKTGRDRPKTGQVCVSILHHAG